MTARRKLQELERLVAIFLAAERAGEMGNRDKAIEALERYMSRI